MEDLVASLRASNNKDFNNSSIPSGAGTRFKKVLNLRNKSDKKVGGQIGHKGHKRKRLEPTEPPVELNIDKKYLDSTKYTNTGTYNKKDLVDLKIDVKVIRHLSRIFISVCNYLKEFTKKRLEVIKILNDIVMYYQYFLHES